MATTRLEISATGYPGTNATLRALNTAIIENAFALSRLCGDKCIITGVQGPGAVSDGWVAYGGEILPFVEGIAQLNVKIVETTQLAEYDADLNNDGVNDILPISKTKYMTFGSGVGSFPFNQLVRLKSILELSLFTLPNNIVIDPDYVHTDNNLTDAILTYLSSLISNVQANWDAPAGNIAAILNKPTNLKTYLKRGSLVIGDVVPQDYTVSFPNVGTVNYKVDINPVAITAATSNNTATIVWNTHSYTQTSFKLRINETGNTTQNLKIFWEIVPSI